MVQQYVVGGYLQPHAHIYSARYCEGHAWTEYVEFHVSMMTRNTQNNIISRAFPLVASSCVQGCMRDLWLVEGKVTEIAPAIVRIRCLLIIGKPACDVIAMKGLVLLFHLWLFM